ncbi:bifunctional glutamate N-acetyltransferase/amino-acid acetyltransferase ArgJ [Desulfurobacterium atlanticum]|uniref:Arginine biosynthesis bifunctional protein ArgJ n=1 Tax=Desulfurobacterium atlanticum TaxID=240169 RepID=A0A238XLN9_9BACT|nr:bifunctional glutamate N-acetyltransferase/amino-acid acetyltransferase ArgJ [Desulfurobacterium atlanticum]SNR59620.1 glutamate N-acetyltransferase [Desulfurobacterium atlanticum]
MKGISDVKGFLCGTGRGGIKKTDKPVERDDVLVIVSEVPAVAAGVFTQNDIKAAPVKVSMKQFSVCEKISGIVANSGNANACTGEQGLKDAEKMVNICEDLTGKKPFIVASTGVIGEPLPMDRVEKGIKEAVKTLGTKNSIEAATAIMTTDTFPKVAFFDGGEFSIGGVAKGAGMIDPAMATMLSFVATDVEIDKNLLQEILTEIVDETFNAITVDGDMSTNDTVFILANGMSKVKIADSNVELFAEGLRKVMASLAYQIVKDGEGATKVVRIVVEGALTKEEARKVARKIALSPLVKTAVFGCDPNWGRIIAAAGSACTGIEEKALELKIGDFVLFKGGRAEYREEDVYRYMKDSDEIVIKLNLGKGKERFEYLTCDLTYDYVRINAEYRT